MLSTSTTHSGTEFQCLWLKHNVRKFLLEENNSYEKKIWIYNLLYFEYYAQDQKHVSRRNVDDTEYFDYF